MASIAHAALPQQCPLGKHQHLHLVQSSQDEKQSGVIAAHREDSRLDPLLLLLCCLPGRHQRLQPVTAVALEPLALADQEVLAGNSLTSTLRHLQHVALLVHRYEADGSAVKLPPHG